MEKIRLLPNIYHAIRKILFSRSSGDCSKKIIFQNFWNALARLNMNFSSSERWKFLSVPIGWYPFKRMEVVLLEFQAEQEKKVFLGQFLIEKNFLFSFSIKKPTKKNTFFNCPPWSSRKITAIHLNEFQFAGILFSAAEVYIRLFESNLKILEKLKLR